MVSMGSQSSLRPLCPTRWTCSESSITSIMKNYHPLRETLRSVAADKTVKPDVRSKANGFARLMENFSFYYGLRLSLHILHMTTPVMRAVQGKSNSIAKNMALIERLSEAVAEQRDRHAVFWSETVDLAAGLDIDEPKLKRQARPPRRLDDGAEPAHPTSPEERYRRVFLEAIDQLDRALHCRYSDNVRSDELVLATGERALITGDADAIDQTAGFYQMNADRLRLQVQMLHDICKSHGTSIPLKNLQDVVKQLTSGEGELRALLDEVATLTRLLLTAPATSCTAERSFSLLRRLKSWLRSTLSQERLNHSAVLATYPERVMSLDRTKLIREFIQQCPSRRHVFGHC
ncbi:hypothetical protein FJT64_004341 [Amphibalanus amphitrite]|uniref:HAT C-terminal dimerisation domain-containing protein n=2 Tax=Amphibalanus amphitrite TaxID=1232801 RepID=A0A6A4W8C4_AMPAM|nr:hypothetical protein FJT64_004341 [Amphibalanus amphitrite]